jgi:hypothetical protein
MGGYGAGKAFNYRYVPSTYIPSKTCLPRQNKIGGGFLPIFDTKSVAQITIKDSFCWPRFIFGGITGFLSMFNNPIGCMAGSPYGTLNSAASAAGAAGAAGAAAPELTAEQEQAKQLTNLKTLFPDVSFVAEKDGKFSAAKKDGTLLNNKTYDEMKDALGKQEAQGNPDTQQVLNQTGKDAVAGGNPDNKELKDAVADGEPGNVDTAKAGNTGKSTTTTKKASTGSGSPKGWYRAPLDKNKNVNATHNKDGSYKNATQVTRDVLDSKLNGALSPAQQKELTAAIIKYNPSVFNKDGTPKANADYTKLDIPTMAWIKEHILKETETTKTDIKGPNSATRKPQGQTSALKNNQYEVNRMAQMGYSEVAKGGIYSKGGKYYYINKNGQPTEIKNSDLKSINSDGSWVDTNGKIHHTFPTLPASFG